MQDKTFIAKSLSWSNKSSNTKLKSLTSSIVMFLWILLSNVSLIFGPWCQNSFKSGTDSPNAVSLPKGVYPLAPPIAGLAYLFLISVSKLKNSFDLNILLKNINWKKL